MIISLIAAMDKNRVIGKENALPWRMHADIKRFRELTVGKPVIMGRNTFLSISKPLPERVNIVLTNDKNFEARGCVAVHSIEEALMAAAGYREVMVIGGASVFEQFLERADRMYLTFIDMEGEGGDTYFPAFSQEEWREHDREAHEADEQNPYPYAFVTFDRIQRESTL